MKSINDDVKIVDLNKINKVKYDMLYSINASIVVTFEREEGD